MTDIEAGNSGGAVARHIAGTDQRLLLVADHASNRVPADIDLGVGADVMADHVAVDIGVGPLTESLAARLSAPAWLALYSRLVCDMNRPQDSPALAPERSDGIIIPGNRLLSREARNTREAMHRRFHEGLGNLIATLRPQLIVSVHSFTPSLKSDPDATRPWPVAVLWNQDERAARLAIAALRNETGVGGPVGVNEPYSGKILNYTMDRHAEGRGVPYVGFEVRQDQIADENGVSCWSEILGRTLADVLARLKAGVA